MSKKQEFNQYLSDTAKWQAFLQTALNEKNLKVTKVTATDINFNASREVAIEVLKKLGNPDLLKTQVVHTIKTAKETNDKTALPQADEFKDIFNLNGLDTLKKLLEPALIKQIFGDLKTQQIKITDDTLAKTMSFTYEATNAKKADSFANNLDTLNFMLGDKKQSVNIMKGTTPKLAKETEDESCEASEFGKSLFGYTLTGKQASVTFNYGHLHAALQEDLHIGTPVLVSDNTETKSSWVINKASTLEYLGKIYDGLVFKDEDGSYRPIAFSAPELVAESKEEKAEVAVVKQSFPHLKCVFLIDASQSLQGKWSVYQEKIQKSIKKITGLQADNLDVELLVFNHKLDKSTFDGKKEFSKVSDHLNKLKPDGTTDLHGAIMEGLESIQGHAKEHANSHSILVLFTDGKHEMKSTLSASEDKVLEQLKLTRDSNLQFKLYTVGIGDKYQAAFFDKIIALGGTHIDARGVADISQLDMFIQEMSEEHLMFKFVADSVTQYLQVPKGSIKVAQYLLSKNSVKSVTSEGSGIEHYKFYDSSDDKDDSNPKLKLIKVTSAESKSEQTDDYVSATTSISSQNVWGSHENSGIEELNFDIPPLGDIGPSCNIL